MNFKINPLRNNLPKLSSSICFLMLLLGTTSLLTGCYSTEILWHEDNYVRTPETPFTIVGYATNEKRLELISDKGIIFSFNPIPQWNLTHADGYAIQNANSKTDIRWSKEDMDHYVAYWLRRFINKNGKEYFPRRNECDEICDVRTLDKDTKYSNIKYNDIWGFDVDSFSFVTQGAGYLLFDTDLGSGYALIFCVQGRKPDGKYDTTSVTKVEPFKLKCSQYTDKPFNYWKIPHKVLATPFVLIFDVLASPVRINAIMSLRF